jgi:uncharacterized membrane protein
MVACFVLLELLVARNPSLTTRLGGAWQSSKRRFLKLHILQYINTSTVGCMLEQILSFMKLVDFGGRMLTLMISQ